MFKVTKRNTRTRRDICPKLTIKTPVFIPYSSASSTSIVNFEQVNVDWAVVSYVFVNCEKN